MQVGGDSRFYYEINPRLFTFLNNKAGFFKHKGVALLDGGCRLWPGARLVGQVELVLFNQFDDLIYDKLEEDSVRTDLVEYQRQTDPQLTMFALEQYATLPGQWQGRLAAGLFERAFAGFGGEVFRLFHDGRWGVGLESEAVRKRDVNNNIKLRDEAGMDGWFHTAFLNLYAQLWPSQGLEGGLKIGRFLAGDPGVRIELRRSFKYFTIGAWYTKTDTSCFSAPENRAAEQKGVYIRFPLALFKDRDVPGHLGYTFTSFTRDQGQTVAQPGSLYPLDPYNTPLQTGRDLDTMRRY
ncbi:MAG: YjbH domain-containing protein [Deltaproteobacteria bacterium]|nr:YjbH domain-containing protein [Candidatus Anaeroferrophillus wilburensis]MBN2888894.1 YjbH domain-containing protein [Deltaproteobacteria bacterium]